MYQSGFLREREPIGYKKEMYCEELACLIMKAKESHHLLFATQRPRKASGIIQSKFEGSKRRTANDVNPSLKVGEDEVRCPSSSTAAGRRRQISSSFAPCSLQAFMGLDDAHPHCRRQSTSLRPPIQMPVSSRNTLNRHTKNQCSSWPTQVDT